MTTSIASIVTNRSPWLFTPGIVILNPYIGIATAQHGKKKTLSSKVTDNVF
jgi:hypothetical protein